MGVQFVVLVVGGWVVDDFVIVDFDDLFCLSGDLWIVGYNDDCVFLCFQLVQDCYYFFVGMVVQCVGWFISEDYFFVIYQGVGDIDLLLLIVR